MTCQRLEPRKEEAEAEAEAQKGKSGHRLERNSGGKPSSSDRLSSSVHCAGSFHGCRKWRRFALGWCDKARDFAELLGLDGGGAAFQMQNTLRSYPAIDLHPTLQFPSQHGAILSQLCAIRLQLDTSAFVSCARVVCKKAVSRDQGKGYRTMVTGEVQKMVECGVDRQATRYFLLGWTSRLFDEEAVVIGARRRESKSMT
ncbi:hypothetical protein VTL71DRAFT_7133, partial [Oculimacula yallundae]